MQPAITQVEAYWHGLCQKDSVPARADIDPRGIRQALDYAFIVERIAPGLARFRLAGSHLSDLMGMEVRGMPLTSFFEPDARQAVGDQLIRLFEAPEIIHMDLTAPGAMGRSELSASLVLLPLRSDLGDISRAIGCLVATGSIGRAPRRFNVNHARSMPALPEVKDPWSAERNIAPSTPGFAEAPATFEGMEEDEARPKLRLVKSDE